MISVIPGCAMAIPVGRNIFDQETSFIGVKCPSFFPEMSISFSGKMINQLWGVLRDKKHPKNALLSKRTPKWIYFWPYSIKCQKRQVVKVVIDPWHSGKTGGLCKQIVSGMSKATGGILDSMFLRKKSWIQCHTF